MSLCHLACRASAALMLALALGGCGSDTRTPVPTAAPTAAPPFSGPTPTKGATSRPAAEVFAEIRGQVVGIRGLQPTAAVEPVTIDEAQLRKNLEAEFDATYTLGQLKDTEDLLISLGLLPGGSSLRTLTLDLQAGQVAGYYSPEKNELFVVNRTGTLGPVDEATYAHEFTHQLQDQHFDLEALGIDSVDQSDRSLARLALVEGDAVSVQTTWMTANLDAREMGELLKAALDPAALEALNSAPAYLRDTAIFPYQDGLAFVTRLLAKGGYPAVDAAFADPPDSTEQILHADKYLTREAPVAVKVPSATPDVLGAGWTMVGQDTLGELILRTWLTDGGVAATAARTAAAGWGGDRLALYRGPDGKTAVLLRTTWDTPGDAEDFAAAARTAVSKLIADGAVSSDPGSTTVEILTGDLVVHLVPLGP
jgi:hypothetical protein